MSITLRRSCDACVRAKRRCNLSAPRCSRCSAKGLDCAYVNQPAPGPSSRPRECPGTPWRSRFLRVAGMLRHRCIGEWECADIPEVVRLFSPATLQRQLDILQTFAVYFAQNGAASFVHPCLYDCRLPEPLQHASRVCANYGIEERLPPSSSPDAAHPQTRQMLHLAAKSTSFSELVAHVQAIALVQITRLLNDPSPVEDSDREDRAFWVLAQLLWKWAPARLPRALSPWRAWLFAESVRRTILVCHIILAVRGVLRRGYAVHLLCVEALPFDMRGELWEAESAQGWEAAAGNSGGPSLVSMRQFAALKVCGGTASPFEDLLLLSFKGDVIRKS